MSALQYFVKQGDEAFQVQIEDQPNGGLRVWLDGEERQVDVLNLPGGMLSLLIDGVSYDVDFEQARAKDELETALNVQVHHSVVPLTVMDERHHRLQELAGASGGAQASGEIVSPMPGKVIEVNVKVGDKVSEDDPVVMLEAMKIEMPIVAEAGGTVSEVLVEPGQTVDSDQVLVKID